MDIIHIQNLELHVRIGVPDEERELPQRLTACITLTPMEAFGNLHDDIRCTVDYQAVCMDVKRLAAQRSRNLVETLGEEIAQMLLASYPLAAVEVELRKYVLPDTEYVAVRLCRTAR